MVLFQQADWQFTATSVKKGQLEKTQFGTFSGIFFFIYLKCENNYSQHFIGFEAF